MQKIINKFRNITPKRAWTENEDIYEMQGGMLAVYGANGRFYTFTYNDDDHWVKTEYPHDIYGRKVWHGFGKGWEDVQA
jgi:hypothetical protein